MPGGSHRAPEPAPRLTGKILRSPPQILHAQRLARRLPQEDKARQSGGLATPSPKKLPPPSSSFWRDGRRPASTGAEWKGLSRWMSPATPPPGSHYSPTSPKNPWGRLMDDERLVRDTLSSYRVGIAVKDSGKQGGWP